MGILFGLTDESKKLSALKIIIKNGDLNNRELEALAQWKMSVNGEAAPILAEVLEVRKYLDNPDVNESGKISVRDQIAEEISKLESQGIEPASLPEAEEDKHSQKLIAAMSAYLSAVALNATKNFAEVLHSKNPIIRRGIGYALYEMGGQMASGDFNYKRIFKETIEGATRGSSQMIIGEFIPKELQKAATVMAQGAIRASFFAISNNVTEASSLANLVLGASTAAAVSNYAVNKASLPQPAIDIINKCMIKSSIDALSSKSMAMGVYSFIVAATRDTAYYLSGGADALQRREPVGIIEGSIISNNIKDISKAFQPKIDKKLETNLESMNSKSDIELPMGRYGNKTVINKPSQPIGGAVTNIYKNASLPYDTISIIPRGPTQVPKNDFLAIGNKVDLPQRDQAVSISNIDSNIAFASTLAAIGREIHKSFVSAPKPKPETKDLDKKLESLKVQFESLYNKRSAELRRSPNIELQKEVDQLKAFYDKTDEAIKKLEEFNKSSDTRSKSKLKREATAIWNSYVELLENRKSNNKAITAKMYRAR